MTRPASLPLDELIAYLDELLEARQVPDACPNGLQVAGPATIHRLVTGVSACLEIFQRAAELEADLVLVHHGLFWDGDPRQLTGFRFDRVAELIRSGTALAAYHLPLDRHAELGNNALLASALGVVDRQPFGHYRGLAIGVRGRLPQALPAAELAVRLGQIVGRPVELFGDEERPVGSVGVVSGSAARLFQEAIDSGLDAFVTGEATEWVVNQARESGTRFLAAGHYATEVQGIRALGEHLAERFGLEVTFVDVPNPV